MEITFRKRYLSVLFLFVLDLYVVGRTWGSLGSCIDWVCLKPDVDSWELIRHSKFKLPCILFFCTYLLHAKPLYRCLQNGFVCHCCHEQCELSQSISKLETEKHFAQS